MKGLKMAQTTDLSYHLNEVLLRIPDARKGLPQDIFFLLVN
jgi:hypothetical protein